MKRTALILVIVLLLGLAGCGAKEDVSQNTETHEFLCSFAEPSRRLKSESGFWYYLKDDGRVARWTFMEDIQENRVENNVVFELNDLSTAMGPGDSTLIYLNYTVTNGMDNTLSPFGDVEIAVLLNDGWYIMPNIPTSDFGQLKSGEQRECAIEVGTIQKSYLPDGHYRIQLKIDELSYAYLEFDMENTAGEMRMTSG